MSGSGWHMAFCTDCELPAQPFRVEAERNEWAKAHVAGTGHTVLRYEVSVSEW